MSKHTYRELIEAQLRGVIVQYDSEQDGHWRDLDYIIDVVLDVLDEVPTKKYYRIKPKTSTVRICNGIELPQCVTEPLEEGTSYYYPHLRTDGIASDEWLQDRYHLSLLKRGLAYLKKEDAQTHYDAIMNIEIKEIDE